MWHGFRHRKKRQMKSTSSPLSMISTVVLKYIIQLNMLRNNMHTISITVYFIGVAFCYEKINLIK